MSMCLSTGNRFLKDAMWKKDKEQEMEKLKQLHNLRQDLVRMHTMAESKDKVYLSLFMHFNHCAYKKILLYNEQFLWAIFEAQSIEGCLARTKWPLCLPSLDVNNPRGFLNKILK